MKTIMELGILEALADKRMKLDGAGSIDLHFVEPVATVIQLTGRQALLPHSMSYLDIGASAEDVIRQTGGPQQIAPNQTGRLLHVLKRNPYHADV